MLLVFYQANKKSDCYRSLAHSVILHPCPSNCHPTLKLFAVEKMPIRRSTSLLSGIGGDFSDSILEFSKSSDVGKPLTIALTSLKSPEIPTSVTYHGSKP